jgi:hypothetical protein
LACAQWSYRRWLVRSAARNHSKPNANTDRVADANAHCNFHCYTYSNRNSYTNTNCNSYTNCYINTNYYCCANRDCYAYSQANTYSQAEHITEDTAHPAPAPVTYAYEKETHCSIRLL